MESPQLPTTPADFAKLRNIQDKHAVYKHVPEGNFYQSIKDLPGGGPSQNLNLLSTLKVFFTLKQKNYVRELDRPPYPIIIDRPTFGDVFRNIRAPDVVFMGCLYSTGVLLGYGCTFFLPDLHHRLVVYRLFVQMFTCSGLIGMTLAPYYRLKGFWDNGLRWRFPEKRIDHADFLTEYLKTSWWRNFYKKN